MKFPILTSCFIALSAFAFAEEPAPPVAIDGLVPLSKSDWDIPDALDLELSLRYALVNNYEIQKAQERIREQDGLTLEVKSVALPNASLNASVGSQDADLLQFPGNENSWAIGIQIRQALYGGGALKSKIRSQKALRKSVLYDLQTVVEDVVLEVKIRYYDVLLARESMRVQEENILLLEDQLNNAMNRLEAGTVSKFDVLQAEVELANARPHLIRGKNAYRIALDEFRRSLGYQNLETHNLNKEPEFRGELKYSRTEFDLADALEQALEKRPELKQLDYVVEANESNITTQRSGYRPDVGLIAGYDFRNDPDLSSLREYNHGWSVGVQANWSIWDGRATRGRVVQARSQLRQAKLNIDEARLGIEVQVRRAVSSLQEAEELVEAANKVVEQAEEALRLADARYGAGAGTQINVLSARVALTEARTNQLQANYSHLVAAANYERAIGKTVYRVVE